jgi:transcriptional regulator with XRE-family HTH domain
VSTRERHRDRGTRLASTNLASIGRELREARRGLGLRQADVARAAGISRAWVSRIELAKAPEVGVRRLSVVGAVVGLDLSLKTYPGPNAIREQGHRALLLRFRALLTAGVPWRMEVPLPIVGDQRAWDAMTELWHLRVAIEAEMRLTDLQALESRLALKLRDGRIDRLILVVADTRANRLVIREHGAELRSMFPLQGGAARAAIRSDRDPGCHLLILV